MVVLKLNILLYNGNLAKILDNVKMGMLNSVNQSTSGLVVNDLINRPKANWGEWRFRNKNNSSYHHK